MNYRLKKKTQKANKSFFLKVMILMILKMVHIHFENMYMYIFGENLPS